MEVAIEPYIWGYLLTLSCMMTWYATTLKVKFLKLYLKTKRSKLDVFTPADFDDYVAGNWGLLGEMLICPICFTHWDGGIISSLLVFTILNYWGLDQSFVALCFFTYPALVYLVLKKSIY